MEKIALIADIHSNIVALKEVLEDIESRGIRRIFLFGRYCTKRFITMRNIGFNKKQM